MPKTMPDPELSSEQSLLDWMRRAPRTLGWDLIMAYDRVRTNRILMQDYIRRFDGNSLLPPITRSIEIVVGQHWEFLYDYRLDAPRLSFERSGFGASECTLSLRVVGGVQLKVERQLGRRDRRVTRIDWVDAVQGPTLVATVSLSEAPASLSYMGRVQLDLSTATHFELSSVDDPQTRTVTGDYFQLLFEQLPWYRKIYVLTTLARAGQRQIFKTGEFALRIYPAPGSALRGSATYGDGAVMVCVAASGSTPGSLPVDDGSWRYPIPAGRSATMMVGQHFLFRRLLHGGLLAMTHPNDASSTVENMHNPSEPVGTLTATRGKVPGSINDYHDVIPGGIRLRCSCPGVWLAMSDYMEGQAGFSIRPQGSQLLCSWVGDTRPGLSYTRVTTGSLTSQSLFHYSWSATRMIGFARSANGTLAVSNAEDELRVTTAVHPYHVMDEHLPQGTGIAIKVKEQAAAVVRSALQELAVPLQEIEWFRNEGLLFSEDYGIRLNSVHLPMDLVMFGDIQPLLSTFSVEPLDVLLAPGATQPFTVDPSLAAVTWSVESVAGFDADPGCISVDGIYIAPSADSFHGAFTMVRVLARTGLHQSRALVRVLKRGVVANPLVVMTERGNARLRMSANTLNGTVPCWSLKTQTGASLQAVPPEQHSVWSVNDHYYIPGPVDGEPAPVGFVAVDEVTVAAGQDTHTSFIVVREKNLMAEARIRHDPDLPEGRIRLELWGPEGVVEAPHWTLVAGGGAVDPLSGIYTVDPASSFRFAVLLGEKHFGGGFSAADCLVLPIPLINLDEVRQALLIAGHSNPPAQE